MKTENRLSSRYSLKYEKLFFDLLFKKFRITKNQTLDIGCGSGFFTSLLDEMGFDVCGLDLDLQNIKDAFKKYHSDFLVANSKNPPFSKNSFDLILSRGLSTFYPDNIENASEQKKILLDLLKIGGVLVFITASNLSGKRTHIQNHEIKNILSFFMKPDCTVSVYFFFAKNHLFKFVGGSAFNPIFSKLSIFLTKLTKRSGYIVCVVKKQK